MYKGALVVFDGEGVLIDGEFLPELAKKLGKGKEVEEITFQGIRGEIKWEDGFYKRIELLKGASYELCLDVANTLKPMEGAKELVEELHKLGIKAVMITGGFSIVANRIKEEIGIDFVVANELIFENGKLTGAKLNVNSKKIEALREIMRKENLENRVIIAAIIDGANDLTLFDDTRLRIAFNAQEVVKERADVIIDEKDLRKALPYIRETYSAYASMHLVKVTATARK
ncbi:MAG: phosphoserine phosphatase SerB [Candidatus Micrarchaeia archaeon]|jgi:phosphoserine phosphatase